MKKPPKEPVKSPALPQENGHSLRAPVLAEMLGTGLLVFVAGLSYLAPGAGPLAPFVTAAILMALIPAVAGVSGAHFNPAISLACVVAGRLPLKMLLPYWAAQLAGMAVAVASVLALKETAPLPMQPRPGAAFTVELVFTCATAFVFLSMFPKTPRAGTMPLGVGVGSVMLAGSLSAAPLSGGLFNPALASAFMVLGLLPGSALWLYWVSALVAAPLAAALFFALNRAKKAAVHRAPGHPTGKTQP